MAQMRFQGQKEWLSKLIAGFANSFGLMLIIIIQYVTYAKTGTVFWTTNWLSVNLLFGIVPMMFILPYFNRLFFQMTGRVYLRPNRYMFNIYYDSFNKYCHLSTYKITL